MNEQQIAPTIPWWKRKKFVIPIAATALVAIVLIVASYTFHWNWTGLTGSQKTTTTTEVTQPSNSKKVTTAIEDQPAKTLWDWLQLLGVLAIPIVVTVGTAVFTTRRTQISEADRKQQHATDLQIAENQQQDELLRTYVDKLSELLLNKELSSNLCVQSIVRARTLAALQMLNTKRKEIILRFLHDSDLLQYVKDSLNDLDLRNIDLSRIDLSGANLHLTNLEYANLIGVDLRAANLYLTNLHQADLRAANLSGSDLTAATLDGADLTGADLHAVNLHAATLGGTNLSKANLSEANMLGVFLVGANLNEANLSNADITSEELENNDNTTPEQFAQIKPSRPRAPAIIFTSVFSPKWAKKK